MKPSSRIRAVIAAGVFVLVLGAAQVAAAESPVARFNAADQAAARAAVLKAADFGAGWKGGLEKATISAPNACPGLWSPKQADLVITGIAESSFEGPGASVSSSAQLYKTPAMTALDWKRTVVDPAILRCVSRQAAADADPELRFVSFKRIPLPALAQYSARFRMILDYTPARGNTVRMLIDTLAFGRGRTALSLTLTAPYADRAAAEAAEVRLARIMLRRIPR